MDNLLEVGDVGILRDIPSEFLQLQSENHGLRNELQKEKNLSGILKLCLAGLIIYIVIKSQNLRKEEE